MNWNLVQTEFKDRNFGDNGNRFLVGNGYIGVRGTLDEDKKEQLVAVNFAGIYDQLEGCVREPLNAPNPFFTSVSVGGNKLTCEDSGVIQHEQKLDFRYGMAKRKTEWLIDNKKVEIESNRFVSMIEKNISASAYTIRAKEKIECEIEIGIDGDVWDINGPHYDSVEFTYQNEEILCMAHVQNKTRRVGVIRKFYCTEKIEGDFEVVNRCGCYKVKIKVSPSKDVTIYSVNGIVTTQDLSNMEQNLKGLLDKGHTMELYEKYRIDHCSEWDKIWEKCLVKIEGDEQAMQALNYSLYHLNSIAPQEGSRQSIGARGLSGQTYKGAVFWDTEMFMLEYFLYTQPEVAKALVEYRIDGLKGAKQKAKEYGWDGAFYAWESQEEGYDACSEYNIIDVFTKRPMRTFFRDKQVHISGAVAYGIDRYIDVTGDEAILLKGGAKMIVECAKFYLSLLLKPIMKEKYEIHDVVGPDEYHERVNNNAYTNRMAKETFNITLKMHESLKKYPQIMKDLEQEYELENLLVQVKEAYNDILIQEPNEEGVIEQFTNYFKLKEETIEQVKGKLLDDKEYWGGAYGVASDTKIIKQADIVTMLEIFHEDYSEEILKANWEYYEPRTEHGSSLSACMYALVACRFNEADKAYPFFLKSAMAEIEGGGKQWAGLLYIGGTHPAAAGGAWKVAIQGFAGLCFKEGEPVLKPCLPKLWDKMEFKFEYRGKKYNAVITHDEIKLEAIDTVESNN